MNDSRYAGRERVVHVNYIYIDKIKKSNIIIEEKHFMWGKKNASSNSARDCEKMGESNA